MHLPLRILHEIYFFPLLELYHISLQQQGDVLPFLLLLRLLQRVDPTFDIQCKLIEITSTPQPNRVLIHKPPAIRVVVPEEVVVELCLTVSILVLQAEGLVCAIRNLGFLF